MVELFKSERVSFPKGKQDIFIVEAKRKLNTTWCALANILNITTRTLTKWKNEKNTISLEAVKKICRLTERKLPNNIKKLPPFWYAKRGAKKGGLATMKKYGKVCVNEERRKERWFEWWKKEGKFKENPILNKPLPIKKPKKSARLAEFVGIVLGDGGISKRQITITLNNKSDKEYAKFVIKLIKKLFGVAPGIYKDNQNSVDNIVVSRTKLVNFCTDELGLKIGNKVRQQVNIPNWIKKNKNFKIACVRGLIDTDGSLIIHKYKSSGKYYSYKKIGFTNRSLPLLKSVSIILFDLKIKNRIMKPYDIRIESQMDVKRYFNVVGSNNPKHLKRYKM